MRLTVDDVWEALGVSPSPLRPLTPAASRRPSPSEGRGLGEDFSGLPFSPARNERVREKGPGDEGASGRSFTGVSTDTRTLKPGELFVALVNDKADGHDFIPQALAAGASGLLVSRDVSAPPAIAVFRVPDTQTAYGRLARWWRDQFAIPVIGVTGSVGKTTVKEMLAAALSPLGLVLKTPASQNNETGVPKALLQLTPDHRAAVVEMGMRGAGQIAYLCGIARPTIGVLTVIGDNHLELLGSRDAIADAKGELLEALPENGIAVLNADDPYFDRLRQKTAARVVTYSGSMAESTGMAEGTGMARHAPTSGSPLLGRGDLSFLFDGVPAEIASPSRHDIGNALAALTVARELGVPPAEAAGALKHYAPPPMRMQVVKAAWGGTVLNDAYNAAPASMQSALETLKTYTGGRKIAFLGDMKELGDNAHQAHQELGETIAELGGLDALYTVGGLAAQIPGAAAYFPSSMEASVFAAESLTVQPGDVVLIKGSRAMAMERIAEALAARAA